MLHFLFRVKPEKIAADLLYEARRALVEHEAQAEHSTAMVAMLRGRIARLDPRIAGESKVGAGTPSTYPVGGEWPPLRKWDSARGVYRDTTQEERNEILASQQNATGAQMAANPFINDRFNPYHQEGNK